MRVAFMLFLKDSLGGAERRLLRIYNAICKENDSIECDIIVRGCDKKTALRLFSQADCDIKNLNILASKYRVMCLIYLLFMSNYELVHFFDASIFNLLTQQICKVRGEKNVYSICNYYDAYGLSSEPQITHVRKQLKMADYIDLLYPSGCQYIMKYIDKGKLSVTPGTFTDLDIFKPLEKERTIVYAAARLEDSKNPILFIEGINACKDKIRREGFRAYLLGKGKYEGYLKQYIEEKHISDIVEMVGYEKTSKYLPTASVFCSLQKLENYPSQSLAEAAATGCYLIITDVGDSRKCADELFASFINDDPEDLAVAIKKYFELSDEEKKLVVRNARAFAEVNYSIEASKEYFKNMLMDAEKR